MGDETVLVGGTDNLRARFLGKELVDALTAPTPREFIWDRPGRGVKKVQYIPGHFFTMRMNECLGFLWSTDIPEWIRDGNQIVEKVVVSVHFPGTSREIRYPDGRVEILRTESIEIRKTQWGSSEIKHYERATKDHKVGDIIDLGDDFKGAGTDGFKKCCTQLGVGLDVYGQRAAIDEEAGTAPTDDQLEALYTRGLKAGMDRAAVDKWATEQEGSPPSQLPNPVVMKLIQELIKRGRENSKKI